MRARSPLIVASIFLGSCDPAAERGGPVEAAVKFFEAAQARRCDEVWRLYSAGTQANIRAELHRRERERDGLPQAETPEQRYCGGDGTLKRRTVRIARQEGNETVVAAELTVRVVDDRRLLPKYPVVTRELRLIREGGAWRVELPRVTIGRGPGWRLVEVGPVDVFYPVKSISGLADSLEATAVVRAPRDTLERALRDPQSWARALPGVKAVQSLERTAERERVQLSFAEPDRGVTVVTRLSGRQVDQPLQETSLQWVAEGGNKAPVYFRGSWRLQPHQDGSTRVTLLLVVIRTQWPGDVTQGIFSAERLAQGVRRLEKAAPESAP
jgi:carbon monoxide dehydrogenase subunit G